MMLHTQRRVISVVGVLAGALLLSVFPLMAKAQEVITQSAECTYQTHNNEQAASCRQCLSNPGSTYVLTPPENGWFGSTPVGSCVTQASGSGEPQLSPSLYPVPTPPYKVCTTANQCFIQGSDERGSCIRVWKQQNGQVTSYTASNTQEVCATGSEGSYVFQEDWRDMTTSGSQQPSSGGGGGRLVNLLSVDSVEELLVVVVDTMVQIGTLLLIFALVLTGFRFVSAQGNPGAVEEARKRLTWVVIGGLLLLGAQAFSLVIKATIESL